MLNTRSFYLKVSAGVRAGGQYREYSFKTKQSEAKKMTPGN